MRRIRTAIAVAILTAASTIANPVQLIHGELSTSAWAATTPVRTACYDCGVVIGTPSEGPSVYCATVDLPDWYGRTTCWLTYVDDEVWCNEGQVVCNGNASPEFDLAAVPGVTADYTREDVTRSYYRLANCKGMIVDRHYTQAAATTARSVVAAIPL